MSPIDSPITKSTIDRYSHTEETLKELDTSYWSTALEIDLGYDAVVSEEPQYVQEFAQDIIQSIPAGSVYFGGTDPGRGLITAFCRSQPEADPFFTLTQNALADGTYLEYLRRMYGGRLALLTEEDSQKTFNDYITDARARLKENKLKPNEQVSVDDQGRIQVTGQVAVMGINAGLARIIFDRNPDREFYIEESFPLDWMFPYLEPHGLIMKINRAALPELSAETVQNDQDYWQPRVQEMIGDWLRPETPLQTVIDFADTTYERKDLSGFTGNPRFLQDEDSQKIFSKLRSAQAGVYAWRLGAFNSIPTPAEYVAPEGAERQRLSEAADLAFRQALALCPYSPEAVARYCDFLLAQGRKTDAGAVLELGMRNARLHGGKVADEMTLTVDKLKAPKAP